MFLWRINYKPNKPMPRAVSLWKKVVCLEEMEAAVKLCPAFPIIFIQSTRDG